MQRISVEKAERITEQSKEKTRKIIEAGGKLTKTIIEEKDKTTTEIVLENPADNISTGIKVTQNKNEITLQKL